MASESSRLAKVKTSATGCIASHPSTSSELALSLPKGQALCKRSKGGASSVMIAPAKVGQPPEWKIQTLTKTLA